MLPKPQHSHNLVAVTPNTVGAAPVLRQVIASLRAAPPPPPHLHKPRVPDVEINAQSLLSAHPRCRTVQGGRYRQASSRQYGRSDQGVMRCSRGRMQCERCERDRRRGRRRTRAVGVRLQQRHKAAPRAHPPVAAVEQRRVALVPVQHVALALQQLLDRGPAAVLVAGLRVAVVGKVRHRDVAVLAVCRQAGKARRVRQGSNDGLQQRRAEDRPAQGITHTDAYTRRECMRTHTHAHTHAPVHMANAGRRCFSALQATPKSSVSTMKRSSRPASSAASASLCASTASSSTPSMQRFLCSWLGGDTCGQRAEAASDGRWAGQASSEPARAVVWAWVHKLFIAQHSPPRPPSPLAPSLGCTGAPPHPCPGDTCTAGETGAVQRSAVRADEHTEHSSPTPQTHHSKALACRRQEVPSTACHGNTSGRPSPPPALTCPTLSFAGAPSPLPGCRCWRWQPPRRAHKRCRAPWGSRGT